MPLTQACFGAPRRVWVTEQGKAYHRSPHCEALAEGHRYAAWRGQEIHDAEAIPYDDARARALGECTICFPGKMPAGAKPCWVNVEGYWVQGILHEWKGSKEEGWRGVVSFIHDGVLETVTKDADDLRPRKKDQRRPPQKGFPES